MAPTVIDKRKAFRDLHQDGCFVLANPWDVGSARLMQALGFKALASTSSGHAWTTGRLDNAPSCNEVLHHLALLVEGVDLPINADFESGFATAPESVALNVGHALQTGVAGLSIEDRDIEAPHGLYDRALAVERIAAARHAIDRADADVVLVARTEGLLSDPQAISPAIDRLVAFAEAGADCLFAPGVSRREDIAAMVRAVAPKPVNVLIRTSELSVPQLADLGVRRVSVGGALARVAWGAVIEAATALQSGSVDWLSKGVARPQLQAAFAPYSAR